MKTISPVFFLMVSLAGNPQTSLHCALAQPIMEGDFIRVPAETLESADPRHDLEEGIRKGDIRFVAVMGYTVEVPGVEDYYERYRQNHGIKIIEGTSDSIRNEHDRRLNAAAQRYALQYNRLLLEHIRNSK